ASAQPVAIDVRSDLAPSGTMHVGINYGQAILARKDPKTGELRGIHVELARELARRVGVPMKLVGYEAAARMVEGLKVGALDIAFLAADPERLQDITFTRPYAEIEATFLVPAGSPLRSAADVDRPGVRIAVAERSVHDLYLRRNLQRALLMPAPGGAGGAYE